MRITPPEKRTQQVATRFERRPLFFALVSSFTLLALWATTAQGQAPAGPAAPPTAPGAVAPATAAPLAAEPSGDEALRMAAGLEQAFVKAIESSERSVVSIARVKRDIDPEMVRRSFRPDLIPQFRQQLAKVLTPADPEFVPNEFATGVVVDSSGLVLTNAHVVDPENSIHYVTTNARRTFEMEVRAADERSDLAVLAVKSPERVRPGDFVPIKFGDGGKLRKGQLVMALGNPYAIARDGQASASWGIVSNLHRKAAPNPGDSDPSEQRNTLHHFGTLIQTDARLNLGTSGGALINLRGEMIGLTTSLAAAAGFEQPAGYAIPVDETFQRILTTLKLGKRPEYGFLGVRPAELDEQEVMTGRQGVRIFAVQGSTPAHRAGLRAGDIIKRVAGVPVFNADDLFLRIGSLPAATNVTLTLDRNGQLVDKTVMLSKFPMRGKQYATTPPPTWRGMQVDFATAVITNDQFDDAYNGSLAVVSVAKDSPAWKAGMRAGMRVSHVGSTRVETPDEFFREVGQRKSTVQLRLVPRPGEPSDVTVGE